jgi:hypothetical protein
MGQQQRCVAECGRQRGGQRRGSRVWSKREETGSRCRASYRERYRARARGSEAVRPRGREAERQSQSQSQMRGCGKPRDGTVVDMAAGVGGGAKGRRGALRAKDATEHRASGAQEMSCAWTIWGGGPGWKSRYASRPRNTAGLAPSPATCSSVTANGSCRGDGGGSDDGRGSLLFALSLSLSLAGGEEAGAGEASRRGRAMQEHDCELVPLCLSGCLPACAGLSPRWSLAPSPLARRVARTLDGGGNHDEQPLATRNWPMAAPKQQALTRRLCRACARPPGA